MKRYLLGYDIGSSSVKASIIDAETGVALSSAFYPKQEAEIISSQAGFAEQLPSEWWKHLKQATSAVLSDAQINANDIAAIGISYQMHGLVCVDAERNVLRPAIIWCDSRGVPYGEKAFETLGNELCLSHLLNSPGNFTATKLAWVRDNEPELFSKIWKIMLPGDYIAMRLTGELSTTVSGLSEMMLWDFKENTPARFLMDYLGLPESILPDFVPTFGIQGYVTAEAASELGLAEGIPVSYRAGDQPNNALSLNVLNPGEVASTAGTSGVVYGIIDSISYDPLSRVNNFANVNHTAENPRLGVMTCISGTGILNSWMKRNVAPDGISYEDMNVLAEETPVGADGVSILPFGNGAERVLRNAIPGCSVYGIDFLRHDRRHLLRAAQEGIAFSFMYGMEIMQAMGMKLNRIHAGNANMFLSPLFRNALAGVSGATIELYDTDGSIGAARGAGIGAGVYANPEEAFSTLRRIAVIEPDSSTIKAYAEAYGRWKEILMRNLELLD